VAPFVAAVAVMAFAVGTGTVVVVAAAVAPGIVPASLLFVPLPFPLLEWLMVVSSVLQLVPGALLAAIALPDPSWMDSRDQMESPAIVFCVHLLCFLLLKFHIKVMLTFAEKNYLEPCFGRFSEGYPIKDLNPIPKCRPKCHSPNDTYFQVFGPQMSSQNVTSAVRTQKLNP
jgi:hypothetical protein